MRAPSVVDVEEKVIRQIRGGSGRRVTLRRWYVTLAFGSQVKRLAISARDARWIRGERGL